MIERDFSENSYEWKITSKCKLAIVTVNGVPLREYMKKNFPKFKGRKTVKEKSNFIKLDKAVLKCQNNKETLYVKYDLTIMEATVSKQPFNNSKDFSKVVMECVE